MIKQHWQSIMRILLPLLGLVALFLPWLSLDVHGPMSGIDLMIYALSGDDRVVFLKADWVATITLLALPFVIAVTSQAVTLGLCQGINSIKLLVVALGSIAALLWSITPLLSGSDSTQTIAMPSIGLILLVVAILASAILQALSPSGLSRRPRIPKRVKNALYNEFGGRCALCGDKHHIGNLDVDHVHPRARGGPDAYENYQLLCGRCNRLKGTRTMAEARARLAEVR